MSITPKKVKQTGVQIHEKTLKNIEKLSFLGLLIVNQILLFLHNNWQSITIIKSTS